LSESFQGKDRTMRQIPTTILNHAGSSYSLSRT
jgi:hypothetical protein